MSGKSNNRPGIGLDSVYTWIFMAGTVLVLLCLFLPVIDQARVEKFDSLAREAEVPIGKERRRLDKKIEERRDVFEERQYKLDDKQSELTERMLELDKKLRKAKVEEQEKIREEIDKTQKAEATLREEMDTLRNDRDKSERSMKKEFRDDENKLKKLKREVKDKTDVLELEDKVLVEGSTRRAAYWYRWGRMIGLMLVSIAALGYLGPSQTLLQRIVGGVVIVLVVIVSLLNLVTRYL